MKSLAEQLREFIDRIQETPAVGQQYDFETTIPNWEQPASADDDAWEEEVDVGVKYNVAGKYYPATLTQPEEHPEMDELSVYDLATGQDITSQISPDVMRGLEERAWEEHDARSEPDPDYGREDRYDRY